jgi:ribosome-binding factor A
MSETNRMDRVARELRAVLTEALHEGLKDPRVGPVTLTDIRVSPDLRHANIKFVPLGGDGTGVRIAEGLNAAAGFLQRRVSKRVRFKYLPVLRFEVDEYLDRALAVDAILHELSDGEEE